MGTSKGSADSLTILREGLGELSCLDSEDLVFHHALKLSQSLCGSASGHVIRRKAGEGLWEIDGVRSFPMSPDKVERLSCQGSFPIDDELCLFLLNELQIHVNRIIPIRADRTLMGALLILEGKSDSGTDTFQETCLALLVQHTSILLSNIQMRKEITEMRTHYEDIIVKKETAEKLASLGTIAAGLAHEIKNPLVSIKTLAQLLPERFDDPEFRDHFANIAINEVDRIGSIVSDLLDFAKSSELKMEPLDIIRLIEDTLRMLTSQFTDKGIIVQNRFAKHLPLIYGDQFQLKQVLLNLFINSMEAMPQGGEITVEAVGSEDMIDRERVIVKISDTGLGIKEEDKEHLFEPFFTTKGTGTGLGLSICKRILEKHQGEISIESVSNEGTKVTLTLPLRKGES